MILVYIAFFSIIFGSPPGSEGHDLLGIEAMAHFADFMLLIGLVFVNLALVRSRRKNPEREREFKVPFVPYVPYLAILANLVLLVNVEPTSFLIGVGAEAVGVAFWFLYMSRAPSVEEMESETPTVVAEKEVVERGYQVLVPIANPENTEQMMRTACDLAEENDGEVLVMTVVELPAQTPLSRGRQFVDEKRELLDEAMDKAGDRDVPVSGVARIGHDVSKAILNTARQHGSDAILMGWRHRPRRRDFVLGSNVDKVVTEAESDVLVEKIGEPEGTITSIMVPIAGGPNSKFALEVAESIAKATGASMDVVTVVSPKRDGREGESLLADSTEEIEVPVETRVLRDEDVAEAILEGKETRRNHSRGDARGAPPAASRRGSTGRGGQEGREYSHNGQKESRH